MARTAMSQEDKIAAIQSGDLTNSQMDFAQWIEDNANIDVDNATLRAAMTLYQDYLKDPEVAAANEEKRAALAEKKKENEAKQIEKARAILEKAGLSVVEAPVADDDDDEDADE